MTGDSEQAPFSLEDWERDVLMRLITAECREADKLYALAAAAGNQDAATYWFEMQEALGSLANRLANTAQVPRRTS